jgi:hypothetical protein
MVVSANESLIGTDKVCEKFDVSREAAVGWITAGILLPDGSRLRLDALRVGKFWKTTWTAVNAFVAAQTLAYASEAVGS